MNKRAFWIALGMGITILVAGLNMHKLRFQHKLSSFLDPESEAYHNEQEYSRQFPSYGNTWIVILDFDKVPHYADLLRIDSLTTKLSQLKGVDRCYSITSMQLKQRGMFGVRHRNMLNLNSARAFQRSWDELIDFPDVYEKFIAQDQKATCIYLEIDSLASESLASSVRKKVKTFNFPHVYYAGSALFTEQAREAMQAEMSRLGSIAALVLLTVLLWLFRSFKSLLLVAFTLAFNIAGVYLFFLLSDHEVNTLTFTVPLLITILSFSDLVHILYAAGQAHENVTWREHVRMVMKNLQVPLGLTSFTTALAFAVFLWSAVPEIIEFSWLTCAGIVWAYVSARFFFPELLIALGPAKKPIEIFAFLTRGVQWSMQRSRLIIRLSVLLSVLALLWSTQVARISYNPYQNGSEELMGGQLLLNERFSGLRSVEVIVSDLEKIDSTTFRKVGEIENYLLQEYGCTTVFSINTVARRLHRFQNYGFAKAYQMPDKIDAEYLEFFWEFKDELGLREALTLDKKTLRIVGRLKDEGSAEAMEKTARLERWLKSRDWSEKVYAGGHSILLDQAMFRVTVIILIGVGISLCMASLLGGLFFRNVRLCFALLLPNLLPLLCALVCMPLFDLQLDPFTAMSLSIIFGLSIDDTIYIAGTYMERRKSGVDISESVRWNVFPVFATSLLLAIGFGIFALSELPSTQSIGMLVPIVLLVAVISDLFLLPPLLNWAVRKSH